MLHVDWELCMFGPHTNFFCSFWLWSSIQWCWLPNRLCRCYVFLCKLISITIKKIVPFVKYPEKCGVTDISIVKKQDGKYIDFYEVGRPFIHNFECDANCVADPDKYKFRSLFTIDAYKEATIEIYFRL